jgi:hypothetical protein
MTTDPKLLATEQKQAADTLASLMEELHELHTKQREIKAQLSRLTWEIGHDWQLARAEGVSHPQDERASGHPRTNFGGGATTSRRRAPLGRLIVIGEDHKYYEDDWPVADYEQLAEAILCADTHFKPQDYGLHVYDDRGRLLYSAGGEAPHTWNRARS